MNFRRGWLTDEPEINLIPMIDILLVIVIFLMVSTQFRSDHGLTLQLPPGGRPHYQAQRPHEVDLKRDGDILVDGVVIGRQPTALRQPLARWGGDASAPVIVAADARISHGQVMAVLDLLQKSGRCNLVLRTAGP